MRLIMYKKQRIERYYKLKRKFFFFNYEICLTNRLLNTKNKFSLK